MSTQLHLQSYVLRRALPFINELKSDTDTHTQYPHMAEERPKHRFTDTHTQFAIGVCPTRWFNGNDDCHEVSRVLRHVATGLFGCLATQFTVSQDRQYVRNETD